MNSTFKTLRGLSSKLKLYGKVAFNNKNKEIHLKTYFQTNHYHSIKILISQQTEGLFITDNGLTFSDVATEGISVAHKKPEAIIRKILKQYQVYRDAYDALYVAYKGTNFNQLSKKLFNLIQAMIHIDDFTYLKE